MAAGTPIPTRMPKYTRTIRLARLDPWNGRDHEFVKPDQRASSRRRATGSLPRRRFVTGRRWALPVRRTMT